MTYWGHTMVQLRRKYDYKTHMVDDCNIHNDRPSSELTQTVLNDGDKDMRRISGMIELFVINVWPLPSHYHTSLF